MDLLYKEHRGKVGHTHLLIVERVLELVQGWGEAFLPYRRDFPGFSDTYHRMCKEGVPFPTQYDASRAPVLSPPRNSAHAGIPEPNPFQDLSPEDTFHVANNVLEMVEDMLAESAKSNYTDYTDIRGNDILIDLHGQLRQLQAHLLVVIERETSQGGKNLDKYLTLNDAIQAAERLYSTAMTRPTSSPRNRKHKPDEEAMISPNKAARGLELDKNDDPFALFALERAKTNPFDEANDPLTKPTTNPFDLM
ncbi:hypothetical protein DYB28_005344 [Aphanomyces astaci]|uniref:VHS domain-containing protein n=1 Tax=Aphanomyces astaci TaxID=112090 RepID=A0A9X8H2G0_APHAT|nr:hypothetical protein DYB28_005344 [Aphanomyces astaci]